jgi:hypothetical protein
MTNHERPENLQDSGNGAPMRTDAHRYNTHQHGNR